MNHDNDTVKTYDNYPTEFAEYFRGIGPRITDIKRGLKLAHKEKDAKVVEIGCGDGRDAVEIVKRVSWYEGFDPSIGLLEIAKHQLPNTSFRQADALSYEYPKNVDVVFSFASLLHVNQNDLFKVFEKASSSLRTGGIFYISLKERPSYQEEVKEDKYGKRMFYYYNSDIIEHIAGKSFRCVYKESGKKGHTNWFTVALMRV